MDTLLLDTDAWDLTVDGAGNIALASDPYAQAQDAASACRLFLGECWYDTTRGVPYFQDILGKWPPLALLKADLNSAAMTVPGVVKAQTFIAAFTQREIFGQVQISTSTEAQLAVTFPLTMTGFTIAVSSIGGPDGIGLNINYPTYPADP